MSSTGIKPDPMLTEWEKRITKFRNDCEGLREAGEFNLENYRLCLYDCFLTYKMKMENKADKPDVKQAIALVDYVYKAIYGLDFLSLHQEFSKDNFTINNYEDNTELMAAFGNPALAPILDEIKRIFDPKESPDATQAMLLEEETLRGRIMAQMEEGALTRTESLKYLIFAKNLRRKALGKEPFNCEVVNTTSLSRVLKKNFGGNKDNRMQLMVHHTGHYTAVECRMYRGRREAIIMDAAQDSRMMDIRSKLEAAGFMVTIIGKPESKTQTKDVKDKIQHDSMNCAFFSYDHLVSSSNMPRFFDTITELPSTFEDRVRYVSWVDMPAVMLRNAQSVSFMQEAYKRRPTLPGQVISASDEELDRKNKDTTRKTILHHYVDVSAVSEETEGGKLKRKQKGIQSFRKEQKAKVYKSLENMTDEQLQIIYRATQDQYDRLLIELNKVEQQRIRFSDVIDELGRSSPEPSDDESDIDTLSDISAEDSLEHLEEAMQDVETVLRENAGKVKAMAKVIEEKLKERLSPKSSRAPSPTDPK